MVVVKEMEVMLKVVMIEMMMERRWWRLYAVPASAAVEEMVATLATVAR